MPHLHFVEVPVCRRFWATPLEKPAKRDVDLHIAILARLHLTSIPHARPMSRKIQSTSLAAATPVAVRLPEDLRDDLLRYQAVTAC